LKAESIRRINRGETTYQQSLEIKETLEARTKDHKNKLLSLSDQLSRQKQDELIRAHQLLSPWLKREGKVLTGIDSQGRPTFSSAQNLDAAKTIHADKLWSASTSPSLTLLSGQGIPAIGIWDVGAVYTNHVELSGRVTLGETEADIRSEANIPLSQPIFIGHATGVAGTLAATGTQITSGLPTDRRGVAYEAPLKTYFLVNDFAEMAEASANGMLFSNHSYGPIAGWDGDIPFWLGPPYLSGEDPEFGGYTADSKSIDAVAYLSPSYLSIWAAGNEPTDRGVIGTDLTYYVDLDEDGIPGPDPSSLVHPADGGTPLPGATPLPGDPEGIPVGPGLDTILSTGCAKNNISVGNIEDVPGGISSSSDLILFPSSSRGPTDDGRIKPDLVANGVQPKTLDYSSGSTDATQYATGTSSAAPCVTGTLGLLQQLNQDSGGNGLLSSTWKALLLNTAIDGTYLSDYLGTAAQNANLIGPDYFFGWGAVDAEAAATLLTNNFLSPSKTLHLCEHVLLDSHTIEIPILHDGFSPEMKIMICWTDPPYQTSATGGLDDDVLHPDLGPADLATIRLMNDLDLRVVTPSGSTLQPWILDPANAMTPATPGDNIRDNVEQIVIPSPVSGTYTLKISHKGSLKALNLITAPPAGTILPENAQFQLLTSGQTQNVSICISGNKETSPLLPGLVDPTIITRPFGGGTITEAYFDLRGHLGVCYQMQKSQDLLTWADVGIPFPTTTFPQTLAPVVIPTNEEQAFYRVISIPVNP